MSFKHSLFVGGSGDLSTTTKPLSISFFDFIVRFNIKILPSVERFFHRCLKFNTKVEGKPMKSFINFPVNLTCVLDILNIMEQCRCRCGGTVSTALDLNFVREHSGKNFKQLETSVGHYINRLRCTRSLNFAGILRCHLPSSRYI